MCFISQEIDAEKTEDDLAKEIRDIVFNFIPTVKDKPMLKLWEDKWNLKQEPQLLIMWHFSYWNLHVSICYLSQWLIEGSLIDKISNKHDIWLWDDTRFVLSICITIFTLLLTWIFYIKKFLNFSPFLLALIIISS